MTRWTGPDRDHDYFESRADEHRPLGDREGIRQFLHDRYNGVIPVTDGMIQAVVDGLAEGQPELTADDEYLYARERET